MISIIPVKTNLIKPEDNLFQVFKTSVKKEGVKMQDGDIVMIASKIISLTEKNFVKYKAKNKKQEQETLIIKESDQILSKEYPFLTIKNGIVCPNGGVDESNTLSNTFILWPKDPFKSAQNFQKKLKKEYKLKNCGVILTDSTCYPLKDGTIQIAIGFAGIEPVEDYRGHKDAFGRKMKISKRSNVDTLANAGGIVMGEGAEKTPFAIIKGAKIEFTNKKVNNNNIEKEKCIYSSLINSNI